MRKQRTLNHYVQPRRKAPRPRERIRNVTVTDFKTKIWRSSIGHYGGMFVEVPREHWAEFKHAIPKRMFPRRVKTVSVADKFTDFGEQRFHKRFPRSGGIIKEVFFADRSKGLRHFDKLFYRSSVVDPFKEPGKPPLRKPNMRKVLGR